MNSPIDLKKELREKLLAMRKNIPGPTARDAAQRLAASLLAAIDPDEKIVAAYRAIRGEIDLAFAMEALVNRGHTLCLPVVIGEGEPLVFRAWKPGDALIPGMYDIEIPAESAEIVIPDAVIVPLLACDAEGNRLGYGAGYYDRTIRALRASGKQVQIIGAAYSIQLAPQELPVSEHDEPLDAVATERSVVRFS